MKASDKEIEEYEYPEGKISPSAIARKYGYDPEGICPVCGRTWKRHASPNAKDRIVGIRREFIPCVTLTKPDQAVSRTGNVAYTDPLHIRDYSPKGKNPGDYWELTTQPSSICVCPGCFTVFPRMTKACPQCGTAGVTGHFAPFPEKLCERPILASSRVGDVVMDFFAGTGTIGVVAKRLGRRALLIDCVEEYCAMSRERVKKVEYQPELKLKE